MTFPCGGKCGTPNCPYVGPTELALKGHVAGKRGWPARQAKAAGTPKPEGPTFKYPALAEWKRPAAGPGAPPPPSTAPQPVIFDTTELWLTVGRVIDETLLKDRDRKLAITEAKAKVLDASIKSFPFAPTMPEKPIPFPWWAPFLLTFTGFFILPLLPEIASILREQTQKRRERKPPEGEAPVAAGLVQAKESTGPRFHVPVPPVPPPASSATAGATPTQQFRKPWEDESEA